MWYTKKGRMTKISTEKLSWFWYAFEKSRKSQSELGKKKQGKTGKLGRDQQQHFLTQMPSPA
jgi:hypothetical protein